MVGLAADDAAERDEAVELLAAAQRDADRLRQFERAGDVEDFERRAGLAQDAGAAVGQAIHHGAVIRRAHDQQVRRRAIDARCGR